MRTRSGEALLDSLRAMAFAMLLEEVSSEFDERRSTVWKAFSTAGDRRGMLELYRSFDLDELKPTSRLAALGVPTLILWGQQAEYLPLDYASRFARQIPGSKLVLLEASAISSSRTSRSAAPRR